eukprot:SM000055S18238  [mRNA]  locus=s55:259926:263061:+ [translate_table: standard]
MAARPQAAAPRGGVHVWAALERQECRSSARRCWQSPHAGRRAASLRNNGRDGDRMPNAGPLAKPATAAPVTASAAAAVAAAGPARHEAELEVDVVIVGAGIIGLSIANRLLAATRLSVALVDAAGPCAGATGAGQGYIWLGHRQPGTPGWLLARRGKKLWEELHAELRPAWRASAAGTDPLGWRRTGSLLLGRTAEEASALQERVRRMTEEGVKAAFLDSHELKKAEPAVDCGEGGAALFPADSQLDAASAVAVLRERCLSFAREGRRAQGDEIRGVKTVKRVVHAMEVTILAAGAWSPELLVGRGHQSDGRPVNVLPMRPRKGHLLALQGLPCLPMLRHGLMECEYISNSATGSISMPSTDAASSATPATDAAGERPLTAGHSSSRQHDGMPLVAVTMTATMDPNGCCLLGKIWSLSPHTCGLYAAYLCSWRLLLASTTGSSREFSGYDTSVSHETLGRIISRASVFLPRLRELSLFDAVKSGAVRTGLRPYCESLHHQATFIAASSVL